MSERFPVPGPVEIIAHRGYSARAPENTVVALERAIEAGADAVEFDLHVAADGTPYLFHDDDLDRTTDGSGPFADRHPEALDSLDAGRWFGAEFTGEPLPRLSTALERIRGRVGRIYPEIKRYRVLDDVDRIVATVAEADLLADAVFISMSWEALERVRELGAEIGIGYIVEHRRRIDAAFERTQGDPHALLDFDARILLRRPAVAERARAAGVELATWTVNDAKKAARLLEMGVPRITTNEVGALLDWKAKL